MSIREQDVQIVVRHKHDCPHKSEGQKYEYCVCRKSLLVYDPFDHSQNRIKTGERDWNKAKKFMREYLNRHDPDTEKDINELDQFRAEAVAKGNPDRVTIEFAIVQYVNKKRLDKRRPGTIENVESFLGFTDPKSSKVLKPGKLVKWLNALIVPVKYLSDLTPAWIEHFVSSWTLSDRTENAQRALLQSFLHFCIRRKFIESNPAEGLGYIKEREGNRTAAFDPDQIEAIFSACAAYNPEVPEQEKEIWRHRLLVYIKLMRFSGADLADVTQFKQSQLDGDVFQYRRQKTGRQTWPIVLPADLAAELRSVPDGCGLTGSTMPFRSTGLTLKEDCSKWRWRIQRVFTLAGIGMVQTDIGPRLAHPKMMRDTFAIEALNDGVPSLNVAIQLGHKNQRMLEKYYLPKCKRRDEGHIAMLRKVMAAKTPKPSGKVIKMKTA
jgi:integrase